MTSPAPTFVAITDLATMRASGVDYPTTLSGWRWLYRCREERGLQRVFVRFGRRILVNVPEFKEALKASQAA